MEERSSILEYLKKDLVNNVNIINFIESYECNYFERIGDSVLVKGTSDRKWVYISSGNEKELKLLMDKLNDTDREFAIIENWMMPILTDGKKIKWKLSSIRLYLPEDVKLESTATNLDNLNESDAEFIYNNSDYKEYLSIEYIIERIKNGVGSCIRYNGNLAAWGITQDDGAIGFLHVMPEYRKNGFGKAVTIDIIHKLRQQGKLPYVHIEEKNTASMNLAQSMGFKADKEICWFEIEN
ncbi:GNAT family N-acetyltransferase [Alkaliphilus peptidifermentans]|uniref:FR47-like protein n=1 Tax=Alkaliphilus peptidifermentans DSM 18978 TaxID=1120976 RepID=A0A1G5D854_9FIRM|nr:GNAT family N-acetyltransferase [Alkaliphilus peptidifermentans]SCY10691.1 FR47-like protein [Alkaliphilus peptidifermentans DSM 18978]